jgi:hypothetical protein
LIIVIAALFSRTHVHMLSHHPTTSLTTTMLSSFLILESNIYHYYVRTYACVRAGLGCVDPYIDAHIRSACVACQLVNNRERLSGVYR